MPVQGGPASSQMPTHLLPFPLQVLQFYNSVLPHVLHLDHFPRQTTTFLPIFTNLAARPADRLAATWPQLTELEIDSLKAMLPSLQSAKVSWEPILIIEKWRWKFFLHYAPPYPLPQPYHFKSHGYGPVGAALVPTAALGRIHTKYHRLPNLQRTRGY